MLDHEPCLTSRRYICIQLSRMNLQNHLRDLVYSNWRLKGTIGCKQRDSLYDEIRNFLQSVHDVIKMGVDEQNKGS